MPQIIVGKWRSLEDSFGKANLTLIFMYYIIQESKVRLAGVAKQRSNSCIKLVKKYLMIHELWMQKG